MQTGHHLSNKSHLHKKVAQLSNASSVSTCDFPCWFDAVFRWCDLFIQCIAHLADPLHTPHIA